MLDAALVTFVIFCLAAFLFTTRPHPSSPENPTADGLGDNETKFT